MLHLAYPHGYNSPAVRRAAAAAGYTSAVAVRHALSSGTDEIYRISRLILRRGHTVADVERWMEGRGAKAAPFPDSLPTVGWRMYRRARALLRGPEFAADRRTVRRSTTPAIRQRVESPNKTEVPSCTSPKGTVRGGRGRAASGARTGDRSGVPPRSPATDREAEEVGTADSRPEEREAGQREAAARQAAGPEAGKPASAGPEAAIPATGVSAPAIPATGKPAPAIPGAEAPAPVGPKAEAPAPVAPAPVGSASRPARRGRLVAALRSPDALNLVPLLVAAALWLWALPGIDFRDIEDFGLLDRFPLTFYAALTVLTCGFVLTLRRAGTAPLWPATYCAAMLVALKAPPAILYDTVRYAWASKHDAIISRLLHEGTVHPGRELSGGMGAYDQWPGFFSLDAALVRAFGVDAAASFINWAPVALGLLTVPVLILVYRTFSDDWRLVWTGVWIFQLANWVGQDYLSPQGFSYLLYLTVFAVVVRHFVLPGSAGALRDRGRLDPAAAAVPPPTTTRQRAVAVLILLPVIATINASHQLTPVMLCATSSRSASPVGTATSDCLSPPVPSCWSGTSPWAGSCSWRPWAPCARRPATCSATPAPASRATRPAPDRNSSAAPMC